MYAITGITGKVGGAVARTLLAADRRVRAVVRDAGKGRVSSAVSLRNAAQTEVVMGVDSSGLGRNASRVLEIDVITKEILVP